MRQRVRSLIFWTAAFWAGLVLAGGQWALAATIDVGAHTLLPNTPGQMIPIFVSSVDDYVQGLDFNAQIGDGGAAAFGDDTGPVFSNVTITGPGEIFQPNNTGVRGTRCPMLVALITTTTGAQGQEAIFANGKLATLTIDTTGFFSGTFPLILNPPRTGPTDFADNRIPVTIINGTISIVDPKFWRNANDPLDVDASGAVSAADALVIIDELNTTGAHALAVPPQAPNTPPPYPDVDGNNSVNTLDALAVIDFLNTGVRPAGFAAPSGMLAATASVPEPSAIVLAAAGALVLLAFRKRLR